MKHQLIRKIGIMAGIAVIGLTACGKADEEVVFIDQNGSAEASGATAGNEQTDVEDGEEVISTSGDAQSTENGAQSDDGAEEEEKWVCTSIHTEFMMDEDQILGRVNNYNERAFQYNEHGDKTQELVLQQYHGEDLELFTYEYSYVYDEHDSITSEVEHSESFYYGQGGQILTGDEETTEKTYEYEYDEKGNIIARTDYKDGELGDRREYTYRSDGTKETMTVYRASGEATTYTYDEDENVVNGTVDKEYTYDEDGNVTRISEPTGVGDATQITEQTYQDGKMIEQFIYNVRDGEMISVWSRWTREYGADGHSFVQTNYLPFDIVTGDNTYTEGIVYDKEYHDFAPLKDAASNPNNYANAAMTSSPLKAFYEQNK